MKRTIVRPRTPAHINTITGRMAWNTVVPAPVPGGVGQRAECPCGWNSDWFEWDEAEKDTTLARRVCVQHAHECPDIIDGTTPRGKAYLGRYVSLADYLRERETKQGTKRAKVRGLVF